MAADKKRGAQTARDMVISLAVIVLAAWVIYLFVPHDESKDPVKTVGYRVELASARRAAPYPVAAPRGLPDTWRATSVRYTADGPAGSVWHLGFITPDDEYAAVEQSDSKRPDRFVDDVTHGAGKTAKKQRIAGEEWTRWTGPKYDALVRTDKDGTSVTVVTGTAGFRKLGELAGALEIKRDEPRPRSSTASPSPGAPRG
ncbi:DUF4245 domain-containing protein [Streptomyces albus subsp. chlorinus]|uniref:DUF4245 domain-containing protein n=1 Tax=Streptomyces albus TaxID=1888 RepID=UPI001D51DB8E|nr:DUF4245 domain-containing protein [Streptomyces albus subsp. chlorinus]